MSTLLKQGYNMSDPKAWYFSKVLWTNLLIAVFIIVQGVTGIEIASSEVEGLVAVVLNIILRFLTTQPVTLKKE